METVFLNWRGTRIKSRCVAARDEVSFSFCYFPFPLSLEVFCVLQCLVSLALEWQNCKYRGPLVEDILGAEKSSFIESHPIVLSTLMIQHQWKLVSSIHNTFSFLKTWYRASFMSPSFPCCPLCHCTCHRKTPIDLFVERRGLESPFLFWEGLCVASLGMANPWLEWVLECQMIPCSTWLSVCWMFYWHFQAHMSLILRKPVIWKFEHVELITRP